MIIAMKFLQYLRNKFICWKRGYHDFEFDSPSVIGDWIKCSVCHKLDEYVPGVHEPKYYNHLTKDVELRSFNNK